MPLRFNKKKAPFGDLVLSDTINIILLSWFLSIMQHIYNEIIERAEQEMKVKYGCSLSRSQNFLPFHLVFGKLGCEITTAKMDLFQVHMRNTAK